MVDLVAVVEKEAAAAGCNNNIATSGCIIDRSEYFDIAHCQAVGIDLLELEEKKWDGGEVEPEMQSAVGHLMFALQHIHSVDFDFAFGHLCDLVNYLDACYNDDHVSPGANDLLNNDEHCAVVERETALCNVGHACTHENPAFLERVTFPIALLSFLENQAVIDLYQEG